MHYRITQPEALIATLQATAARAEYEATQASSKDILVAAALRLLYNEASISATLISERYHSELAFARDLEESPRNISIFDAEVDRCNAVLNASGNNVAQFGHAVRS